jgi:hypothetical protein
MIYHKTLQPTGTDSKGKSYSKNDENDREKVRNDSIEMFDRGK